MLRIITLEALRLRNFKGIKELQIDFAHITNIKGENGTGKTTIFDAFSWLLFDKDSQDRKDFEIKTLGTDGQPIHFLEHEVEGVLTINSRTIKLRKVFKEKWVKRRGDSEKEFSGHEADYYVNDTPMKKSEYQDYIAENIIDETQFKLISNPLYFSTLMKWQDRRTVLMDIIGDITPDRVIDYKSSLRGIENLLVDTDIDTLRKSLAAQRKKLNEDIKQIPFRIDEAERSKVNYDFAALEVTKQCVLAQIKEIEDQLQGTAKADILKQQQRHELYSLQDKLAILEREEKKKAQAPYDELQVKLTEAKRKQRQAEIQLSDQAYQNDALLKKVEKMNAELPPLRDKYTQIAESKFELKEDETKCPTCGRHFEDDVIEHKKQEMLENFNLRKSKQLEQINQEGKTKAAETSKVNKLIESNNALINDLRELISDINSEIKRLEADISNFEPIVDLESNAEYLSLKQQIAETMDKFNAPETEDNQANELKKNKATLATELEGLNRKLGMKDLNQQVTERIEELKEKEKELADKIAKLEGQEMLAEDFVKTKVELLESSINSKFKYVRFKLFDQQQNGGIADTCEALIDGVPFSNANKASQYNAGVDIINTLTDYYGVQAVIFIDNRESINDLIESKSQIVNLIVSKDNQLRIESEEK